MSIECEGDLATAHMELSADNCPNADLASLKTSQNLLSEHLLEYPSTSESQLQDVEDILLRGQLGGAAITGSFVKDSYMPELDKRAALLRIYSRDPVVAYALVQQSVAGFHVTRSATLPSILQAGLLPESKVRSRGDLMVMSGERVFSPYGGNLAVSFADWSVPATLRHYYRTNSVPYDLNPLVLERSRRLSETLAEQTIDDDLFVLSEFIKRFPDSDVARLTKDNYPVAVGANPDRTSGIDFGPVDGEFKVCAGLPPESIGVIAVDARRMAQTRKIIQQYGKTETGVIKFEPVYSAT